MWSLKFSILQLQIYKYSEVFSNFSKMHYNNKSLFYCFYLKKKIVAAIGEDDKKKLKWVMGMDIKRLHALRLL